MQKDMPEICKYCEMCTKEYNTNNHFCLDVSVLRMILFGPRPVSVNNTCKRFTLHSRYIEKSR